MELDEQATTKYVFETTDRDEAEMMLKSRTMQVAIDSYHMLIFRDRLKNPEFYNIDDAKYELLEKIADELRDHFYECFMEW